MTTKINTLVLSGGGLKGLAYCGIFRYLQELQLDSEIEIDIKNISGVSVGSFFGLIYILKYEWKDLYEEILSKRFANLKDIKYNNFIESYGLDSGNGIIEWLETMMLKKGYEKNITFKELYYRTGIHFRVFVTNLNKYTQEVLDHINSPDMCITFAIRMSMSIPVMFTCKKYNNNIYVDGALIDNYPIEFHDESIENVLGINLISENTIDNVNIDSMSSYLYNVTMCYLLQIERLQTKDKYISKTICIMNEKDVPIINFKMTKRQKIQIINTGYKSAYNYFKELVQNKNKKI